MLARRKRPHHSGFWCRTFESVAASLLTIASTAVSNFDTQGAPAPYRPRERLVIFVFSSLDGHAPFRRLDVPPLPFFSYHDRGWPQNTPSQIAAARVGG
jgi:hypothetical protein